MNQRYVQELVFELFRNPNRLEHTSPTLFQRQLDALYATIQEAEA